MSLDEIGEKVESVLREWESYVTEHKDDPLVRDVHKLIQWNGTYTVLLEEMLRESQQSNLELREKLAETERNRKRLYVARGGTDV